VALRECPNPAYLNKQYCDYSIRSFFHAFIFSYRISTVTGYSVQEVLNLNAFMYICEEDMGYMQAIFSKRELT
jgi:hypothetical protein